MLKFWWDHIDELGLLIANGPFMSDRTLRILFDDWDSTTTIWIDIPMRIIILIVYKVQQKIENTAKNSETQKQKMYRL